MTLRFVPVFFKRTVLKLFLFQLMFGLLHQQDKDADDKKRYSVFNRL